ncbi:MAG TPA: aldo/keto reductase [Chloroflexota bacterium]|nr:aldo/keto reductase [Chloroflexota bacterium]
MQYRKMGTSDLEVSVIGFGCWESGGSYGAFDEQEIIAAVARALDLGVTLFDTAPAYGAGRSEELLGRALGARRHEAIVVTKCGIPTRPGQKERRDARYPSIIEDVEQSLRLLNMDYVDLLLQHWPDPDTPIEESMRALVDLQRAGKARYIGVSNFHPQHLREARQYAPIITNQVGYNLFDRRWEHQMFPLARELGIGVMAYGPMAHGLLTGSFTTDTRFDDRDWRRRGSLFGQQLLTEENLPRNLEVVEQLGQLARELGTGLPPLAIAWVLRDPLVAVALSGTRRPQEIEENVKALEVSFTPEVLTRIEGIMSRAAGQSDLLPS